jgi:hypothetical protein
LARYSGRGGHNDAISVGVSEIDQDACDVAAVLLFPFLLI